MGVETLKDIDPDTTIGFEEENDETKGHIYDAINAIEDQTKTAFEPGDVDAMIDDDDDEVQIIGGQDKQTIVLESIRRRME
jgi:hypothetical protein